MTIVTIDEFIAADAGTHKIGTVTAMIAFARSRVAALGFGPFAIQTSPNGTVLMAFGVVFTNLFAFFGTSACKSSQAILMIVTASGVAWYRGRPKTIVTASFV